jgi:hypothetical protein
MDWQAMAMISGDMASGRDEELFTIDQSFFDEHATMLFRNDSQSNGPFLMVVRYLQLSPQKRWELDGCQNVESGVSLESVPSQLTRRFPMKKILLSIVAVVGLVGFGTLSFAEDMGKMKDEMKGKTDNMMGKKDEMKGAEMKGGEMKTHDGMKNEMGEAKGKGKMEEMKDKVGEMKDKMKGKPGEMGK